MCLCAPTNWQVRVKSKDELWRDYLGRVLSARGFIERIEEILDRYHYLIEKDLLNDLSDLIFIMNHFSWSLISTKEEHFLDGRMVDVTINSSDAIGKALTIMKDHRLLKYSGWSVGMKKDKPSIFHYGEALDDKTLNILINFYEQIYNDSVQFRDAFVKITKQEKPLE